MPPRGFDGDTAIKTHATTDAREDKGDGRANNVIFGGLETRRRGWGERIAAEIISWSMGVAEAAIHENNGWDG